MEWIKVEDELPKDWEKVLTLCSGQFESFDKDPLCQKISFRIFEGIFSRRTGWYTPDCKGARMIIAWMPRPKDVDGMDKR